MGNQLVSSVKTVIRPIDYYLDLVPDISLKNSLGQTQFLKVTHCSREAEGEIVVKLLSHEAPSLLLEPYKHELLEFADRTANNWSIASFRNVEIKPTFAYMIRQYVRHSLYDRLSTRPFLTDIEKCWIVYQVFRCMAWCHERRIYHGDIKLENILVTSNLWVIMADFALYKPVSLPEDNPSFFNYFFDISRRRCCNIAPERFVPTASLNQMDNPATLHQNSSTMSLTSLAQEAQLTDKMDMFSIGCTMAEIFADSDSNVMLFDLGELLTYKKQEGYKRDRLDQTLKKIDNEVIRELVLNLISLEPAKRKSCDQVLDELRGVIFPKYFDMLYNMMRVLVRLPPDSKILYLTKEFDNYLPVIIEEDATGILILLMTITASLRSFTHTYIKIQAQRLICKMVLAAPQQLSPFIADRLIPYFGSLIASGGSVPKGKDNKDPDHRARGEAIHSLPLLLEQVETIPVSDANIFTDYLMEILIKCVENDKSTYVRLCMAQNVGRLSRVALNFLNQSCDQNYEEELNLLHTSFGQLVVNLLTDSNNCVRRTLLLTAENCSHLCTFFGRQKTTDVILPHIFTFLNHKNDFQLRLSFFDNIITIAAYLGVQCSTILYPLLQQGLCDAEEIIIGKTINSIASLVEQGLLQKNVIYDLLREILPLLYHPNQWIVHSIVYLLTTLSDHLSVIDLHCKVIPMLEPFLSRKVHSLSNKYLLLDSLKPTINRNVYTIVMESKDGLILDVLFQILRNQSSGVNNVPYKRLVAENINPYVEGQLLLLSDLISKTYRNRRNYLANQNRDDSNNHIIDHPANKFVRSFNLQAAKYDKGSESKEWEQMFGPRSGNGNNNDASHDTIVNALEAKEMEFAYYFECPPTARGVKRFIAHKKKEFSFRTSQESPVVYNSGFRPRGILGSQLYEHKSSVNQLALFNRNPSSFFSCSNDGTIRYWDLATFDNRNVINRSKFLFRMEFSNGTPINFKGIVNCGKYVVTYSSDGIVYVFEVTDTCLSLVCQFKVGHSKGSIPLIITSICALSANIFAVSLSNSMMYGFDVRQMEERNFFVPVFKVAIGPNQRVITCIDGSDVVLYAATASGFIAGFDLRFLLRLNHFLESDTPTRVTRIKFTPEGLYTATSGTSNVMLWDYKVSKVEISGTNVLKTLRTCNPQPEKSSASVNAILPIASSHLNQSTAVITGGTDMRIRYWDVLEPERSYIINDPALKACNYLGKQQAKSSSQSNLYFDHSMGTPPLATYVSKRIDAMQLIEELDASVSFGQYKNSHFCSLDQQSITSGHHDSITDLLRVNQYLVSAGSNGTIKVWR